MAQPRGKARVNAGEFVDAMRRTQLISDSRHKIRASRSARYVPGHMTLSTCLPDPNPVADALHTFRPTHPGQRNKSSLRGFGEYYCADAVCAGEINVGGSGAPNERKRLTQRSCSPRQWRTTDPLVLDDDRKTRERPLFDLHKRHFSRSASAASDDSRGKRRSSSAASACHIDLYAILPKATAPQNGLLETRRIPAPLPDRKHRPGRRWVSSAPRDTDDIIGMGYDMERHVDPFQNHRLRHVVPATRAEDPPGKSGRRMYDHGDVLNPDSCDIGLKDPKKGERTLVAQGMDVRRRAFTPQPRKVDLISWQRLLPPSAPKENVPPCDQATRKPAAAGVPADRVQSQSPFRGKANVCSNSNILAWI